MCWVFGQRPKDTAPSLSSHLLPTSRLLWMESPPTSPIAAALLGWSCVSWFTPNPIPVLEPWGRCSWKTHILQGAQFLETVNQSRWQVRSYSAWAIDLLETISPLCVSGPPCVKWENQTRLLPLNFWLNFLTLDPFENREYLMKSFGLVYTL